MIAGKKGGTEMNRRYTPERAASWRKKAGRVALLAAGTAAVTLAGCTALCFGVTTENAEGRLRGTVILFALGLFAVWTLLREGRKPALREAEHEEGVLKAPPEERKGFIRGIGQPHPIPGSITFLPVMLEEKGEPVSLKLNARLREAFPAAGTGVRLETRRGYITGWEETAGEEG